MGDVWSSVNRVASVARMNLKSILVGTGDQILAKSSGSLQTGQLASVTLASTGGALSPGIYRWSGSAWTSPQGGIHTHTGTADGGSFKDILIEAIENTWYANLPSLTHEMFKKSGTGGTYSNSPGNTDSYVEISTGTTSSNGGNLHYGGIIYTFAQPTAFVTKIQLASTTTSSQARCGMNMEPATAVTDNLPKYGFEGCASCNSSSMSIVSSDGTTRSKNTTSADNYATLGKFIMMHNPGVPHVKYRKEGGAIITKQNPNGNIPGTNPAALLPTTTNTWLCGIQTTTTAARTLRLYGFEAVGTKEPTWPVIT